MSKNMKSLRQFRIRTLLLLMTVVAVGLGILVVRTERQDQITNAVAHLGGDVTYAHEIASNGVQEANPGNPGPDLITNLVGDRHFRELFKISFEGASDETIKQLGDLRPASVEHLLLVGSPITDAALVHLTPEAFPNLRRLRLDETHVTSQGLKHLKQLPNLENLYLSSTAVESDGLTYVREMPKLKVLDVTNTKIDRDEIARLRADRPGLLIIGP
jgi:hypothetical protein